MLRAVRQGGQAGTQLGGRGARRDTSSREPRSGHGARPHPPIASRTCSLPGAPRAPKPAWSWHREQLQVRGGRGGTGRGAAESAGAWPGGGSLGLAAARSPRAGQRAPRPSWAVRHAAFTCRRTLSRRAPRRPSLPCGDCPARELGVDPALGLLRSGALRLCSRQRMFSEKAWERL